MTDFGPHCPHRCPGKEGEAAPLLRTTHRITADTSRPPVQVLVGSKWTAHTSRVASQAFSPDNLRIASGGLDESVYIWSVKRTLKNLPIKVRVTSARYYSGRAVHG